MGEIQLPSSFEARKSQFVPQKRIGKVQLPSAPTEGRDQASLQQPAGETPSFSSLGIRKQFAPPQSAGETPPTSLGIGIRRGQISPPWPGDDGDGETPPPTALGIGMGRGQISPQWLEDGETPPPTALGIGRGQIFPQQPVGGMQVPASLGNGMGRGQIFPQQPVGGMQAPASLGNGTGRGQISPQQPVGGMQASASLGMGVARGQIFPQQSVGGMQASVSFGMGVGSAQISPQQLVGGMQAPSAPVVERSRISPQKPVGEISLPAASRVRRGKSAPQKHATLTYFTVAFLVTVVIALAGFHAAGISPSTLFAPHASTASNVSYPLPNVNPLFTDMFVSDASGWNQQSSPNNYAVTLGNGTLTLEVKQNKLLWEPLPGTLSYSDFVLSVNAILAKGDQNSGYGVYIRGAGNQNSDLATYYRFELYGDASYAIFKGSVDQNGNFTSTKIVDYTLNPAILKQGQSNHLMISAQGSTMSLIVNGQLIKTFSDPSYTNGSIALFASDLAQAKPDAQVQFSQLSLYPVQVSKE